VQAQGTGQREAGRSGTHDQDIRGLGHPHHPDEAGKEEVLETEQSRSVTIDLGYHGTQPFRLTDRMRAVTDAVPDPGRRPAGAALLREEVTSAILRAALTELTDSGYARMSMDAVARR
jgi:hypothetical protein